ncbi:MAG: hypothetical protein ACYCQK_01780 [Acidiferrobacteraceae bacterium]
MSACSELLGRRCDGACERDPQRICPHAFPPGERADLTRDSAIEGARCADPATMRAALEYLADEQMWLGDPRSPSSVLIDGKTPFELARQALGRDA